MSRNIQCKKEVGIKIINIILPNFSSNESSANRGKRWTEVVPISKYQLSQGKFYKLNLKKEINLFTLCWWISVKWIHILKPKS